MSVKKFISVIIVLVAFSLVFNVARAATAEELSAEIARLQAQIAQLQKQLAEIQAKPAVWCHDFNTNLRIGDSSSEITALQTVLQKEGFLTEVSGEFDEKTASAVVGFQEKYKAEILTPWGLEHGTGYVGKTTRAKLNALYGCGVIPPFPVKSITVLSPNGGEQWAVGSTQTITWKTNNVPASQPINIVSFKDSSGTEYHLLYDTPNDGSQAITVPNITLGSYRLYLETTVDKKPVFDYSGNYFSIVPKQAITCTDSDGGDEIYTKGTIAIKNSKGNQWTYTDYCQDSTAVQEYNCLSDASRYTEDNASNAYLLAYHSCPYGCQNGVCLAQPQKSITILSPNGGEKWQIGQTYEIKWVASGLSSVGINIENDAINLSTGIADNVSPGIGSYSWTIPSSLAVGDKYEILIGGEKVIDVSDNYFSIVEATTACTDSDGGKNYYQKGTVTENGKTYTDYCQGAFYLKEYFCLPYSSIGLGGAAEENVVCPNGGSCKDGACVATPSIAINSNPQADSSGNVTIKQGNQITITGVPSNLSGQMGVDYTRAFFFDSIFNNSCSNTDWVMTCTANQIGTSNFYIRLYKGGQTYQSNVIKVTVVAPTPSITVLSPNGGERWIFSVPQTITWTSTGMTTKGMNVYIYLAFPDGAMCKLAERSALDGVQTITLQENQQCPNIPRTITAGQYKIAIYGEDETVKDFSDNYFSVVD
ncbi:MAG: hypothetical protein COX90_02840 [Candidatus Nealsonbacteria bacterium CG_4_10_14_0_2_um_filter_38_17]|uniref:Peptidoglycan binding-like domain-containing protein n=2 Tax=Candidatus Nealsoniibacteriota TaxID=1817911 RepID=A0A2M7UXX8_9BACT|nr:MAG: hypothetical protein COX36_01790 [Candidatus Nealsonbacteria bacterium CG23_combo_of_CG06-09_8_20_14_all_38_19]PIZ88768.1 MAG: hypothetical protein COX90_02840 [Candidatus Nealsonbacteria bacterium CG_4_10_14_0_2_um_filter_38_17]